MKNIKLTKASAFLAVAALTTSCVVGGSFAKYITKGGASDSARVAKQFGINVEVTSMFGAFNDEYLADTEGASGTFSVDSLDEENVVAPGTNGEAFQVKVSGHSEVATALDFDLGEYSDIVLKSGRYEDSTTPDAFDLFTLETDYYPIIWTLTNNTDNTVLVSGTLADIQTYFDTNVNREVGVGEELNIDYTLSWEWPYENESITYKDAADTYLSEHADESGSESFDFTAVVTQID